LRAKQQLLWQLSKVCCAGIKGQRAGRDKKTCIAQRLNRSLYQIFIYTLYSGCISTLLTINH